VTSKRAAAWHTRTPQCVSQEEAGEPAIPLAGSLMNHESVSRANDTWRGCRLRLRPLAACLALAFSASTPGAGNDPSAQGQLAAIGGRHVAHSVRLASNVASAVTFIVNTCDDPPPVPLTCAEAIDGTVREGFLCAQNNDTIDLTQLVCSKITLNAPLVAGPGSLKLDGPGQDKLTIDAAGKFQALVHNAGPYNGLYVNGLTIANGHYDNPRGLAGSGGGCISSSGNVFLNYSAVSSCYVSSSADALGGGIFASYTVSLYHSSVTGSTAHGKDSGSAGGGGIFANYLELNRSTVSGNTASYTGTGRAVGGGVSAYIVRASDSTVSGNGAATATGGIDTQYAYLFNSTVSGNHADHGPIGGIYVRFVAQIFSCTIAANTGKGAFAAGLYGGFAPLPKSIVQSTIIANNRASGVALDVGSLSGVTLAGSNNLIMAPQDGTRVPFDTIVEDPSLGPLQDNGGPTRTQAPLPGSPAINAGKVSSGVVFDQRGFARVVGIKPDIGAVEFDPDLIFGNGFNL
jgi:hypothetical protein